MKVGGRRRIVIPPGKAYGRQGAGGVIGPDETLVFVVDLIGVASIRARSPVGGTEFGAIGGLRYPRSPWPSVPTSVPPRAPRTCCRPSRLVGRRCWRRSPGWPSSYGYGLIQSPMFEDIEVFQRIGEGTDVVAKEMYDFEDKGGRHVALRPEGTAPVARAFVQHRPPVPWKVWYATPAFRYEQPQAGRLRQHHQVGIECIGSADPDVDVEVIAFGHTFLSALGLQRLAAGPELHGDAGRPGRVRRGAAGVAAGPRRRPGARRRRQGRRRTPSGCSTRRTRSHASRARRRPAHGRVTSTPRPWLTANGCRPDSRARHPVRGRRDPRARPRLLHAHPVRVPERRPSATPSPRSSAAGATTGSSSSSAARLPRASASAAASSGSCSPATPRASSRRPTVESTCSSSTSPAATAAVALTQRAASGAGSRADRAFDARSHEGPDEGSRELRRPVRGDHRRASELPDGTVTVRDLAASEQTTMAVATVVVDHVQRRCIWTPCDRADAHPHVR